MTKFYIFLFLNYYFTSQSSRNILHFLNEEEKGEVQFHKPIVRNHENNSQSIVYDIDVLISRYMESFRSKTTSFDKNITYPYVCTKTDESPKKEDGTGNYPETQDKSRAGDLIYQNNESNVGKIAETMELNPNKRIDFERESNKKQSDFSDSKGSKLLLKKHETPSHFIAKRTLSFTTIFKNSRSKLKGSNPLFETLDNLSLEIYDNRMKVEAKILDSNNNTVERREIPQDNDINHLDVISNAQIQTFHQREDGNIDGTCLKKNKKNVRKKAKESTVSYTPRNFIEKRKQNHKNPALSIRAKNILENQGQHYEAPSTSYSIENMPYNQKQHSEVPSTSHSIENTSDLDKGEYEDFSSIDSFGSIENGVNQGISKVFIFYSTDEISELNLFDMTVPSSIKYRKMWLGRLEQPVRLPHIITILQSLWQCTTFCNYIQDGQFENNEGLEKLKLFFRELNGLSEDYSAISSDFYIKAHRCITEKFRKVLKEYLESQPCLFFLLKQAQTLIESFKIFLLNMNLRFKDGVHPVFIRSEAGHCTNQGNAAPNVLTHNFYLTIPDSEKSIEDWLASVIQSPFNDFQDSLDKQRHCHKGFKTSTKQPFRPLPHLLILEYPNLRIEESLVDNKQPWISLKMSLMFSCGYVTTYRLQFCVFDDTSDDFQLLSYVSGEWFLLGNIYILSVSNPTQLINTQRHRVKLLFYEKNDAGKTSNTDNVLYDAFIETSIQ